MGLYVGEKVRVRRSPREHVLVTTKCYFEGVFVRISNALFVIHSSVLDNRIRNNDVVYVVKIE